MSSKDTTQISDGDSISHLHVTGDDALLISVSRAAGNFTDILVTNGSVISITLCGRALARGYIFKV